MISSVKDPGIIGARGRGCSAVGAGADPYSAETVNRDGRPGHTPWCGRPAVSGSFALPGYSRALTCFTTVIVHRLTTRRQARSSRRTPQRRRPCRSQRGNDRALRRVDDGHVPAAARREEDPAGAIDRQSRRRLARSDRPAACLGHLSRVDFNDLAGVLDVHPEHALAVGHAGLGVPRFGIVPSTVPSPRRSPWRRGAVVEREDALRNRVVGDGVGVAPGIDSLLSTARDLRSKMVTEESRPLLVKLVRCRRQRDAMNADRVRDVTDDRVGTNRTRHMRGVRDEEAMPGESSVM